MGYRAIVPNKLRNKLLHDFHATHLGASKKKWTARQYFWWPKLDTEIEDYVKSCEACKMNSPNPNKAVLIKFEDTKEVLERIHIDFLGPVNNKVYIIIKDAYSKWVEVQKISPITAEETVIKVREFVARYGLPKKIVTDNGSQFIAEEFQLFCKRNGIRHVTTAPAHPSTNGLAENAVKDFKLGLKKALLDPKNRNVL